MTDTSVPRFYTTGGNKFRQNGVITPFIINSYGTGLPTYTNDNTNVRVDDGLEASKKSLGSDNSTTKVESEKNAKLNVFQKGLIAQSAGLQSLKNINPKNYIERLKDSTISNVKIQIANLVNGRINILSRTINKLGIGFVGGKGVRPPKNVYTQDQGALGNALSNVSDRFFYDVRNQLTDFAGDSLSSFLNGGINSLKGR